MSENGWIEEGLRAVGGWGRLQWRLAILLAVPVFLTGMYGTNYVFLAKDLKYRCRVPECEGPAFPSEPQYQSNSSIEGKVTAEDTSWQSWALVPGSRCLRRQSVDQACSNTSFIRNQSVPCEEFVYEEFDSIVYDFDLGCKEWLRNMVGTIHNVGMLISLPIMGYVSDRWGRRTALLVSGLGAGVVGFLKSFSISYWMYVSCELVETIMGASVYPAAFVLMLEWLSAERRELASLALGVPLSLGGASLALLAAGTRSWRLWARFAYPPALLLIPARWLLPESVRWLSARGRHGKAQRVLRWAAKDNRTPLPDAAIHKAQEANRLLKKDDPVEGTDDENLFKAFLKYSSLRRRLCVCGVWWASGVFVVYGLWVRAAVLAGDLTTNYTLLALVELPALLANTALLARAGRRAALRSACLLTAAALTTMPLLPTSCHWCSTVLFVLGKAGANMTLNALYVYSAELFPTRARQRLLAACSALGRLAGVLAPLTPMLAVYGEWVPTLVFGSLPLLSAALTLLLPDTLGSTLPHSLAELQRLHDQEAV